ncbi:DsbA family protein [Thermaurantiacus tibetensis]|uniref:DsbA family protein n=1 Tax=Thermaurantiacus tibetensis TaxID=2759035 RepID=UPI00188FB406|nr:DsbA family protein [Thermaurantiacus tibetensis]
MTEASGPARRGVPLWIALTLAVALGAALGALGLHAFDPQPDPPAGDRAFAEKVRAAILADPQVIPDAITKLQDREVARLLASNRQAIETPFAGAWAGAEDADVVLVEFFDFACPYCRQGKADVDRLLAEDPKLKVVWRDFPVLGETSEKFARASLSAARQGRYRAFLDAAFAREGRLSDAAFIPAVRKAGLDERRLVADLADPDIRAEIDSNLALARALGLTGTPSYIVGDRIIAGAVGIEELRKAIAEARRRPPAAADPAIAAPAGNGVASGKPAA